MADTENTEYAVGDAVDMADVAGIEKSRTFYGTIKRFLPTGRVVVHFEEPNLPNECARCGRPKIGLSQDLATGEVVCMTGCGHKHGFREWDVEISTEALISNITRTRARERLQELAQD